MPEIHFFGWFQVPEKLILDTQSITSHDTQKYRRVKKEWINDTYDTEKVLQPFFYVLLFLYSFDWSSRIRLKVKTFLYLYIQNWMNFLYNFIDWSLLIWWKLVVVPILMKFQTILKSISSQFHNLPISFFQGSSLNLR